MMHTKYSACFSKSRISPVFSEWWMCPSCQTRLPDSS